MAQQEDVKASTHIPSKYKKQYKNTYVYIQNKWRTVHACNAVSLPLRHLKEVIRGEKRQERQQQRQQMEMEKRCKSWQIVKIGEHLTVCVCLCVCVCGVCACVFINMLISCNLRHTRPTTTLHNYTTALVAKGLHTKKWAQIGPACSAYAKVKCSARCISLTIVISTTATATIARHRRISGKKSTTQTLRQQATFIITIINNKHKISYNMKLQFTYICTFASMHM